LSVVKHFIHRETHLSDPEFLHEERRFLDAQREALAVMEQHRAHLERDIESARNMAHGLGISLAHAPESGYRAWLALLGVGNPYRRDDGAGLEVARRLRATRPPGIRILEEEGEPASLIQCFELMQEVLIIDAVSTGGMPGELLRFDATHEPLPAETFRSSTHALGVGDAIELARALDKLPPRVAVYGIEGESFEAGEGLSPAVEATVASLVTELHEELGGEDLPEDVPAEKRRPRAQALSGNAGVVLRLLEAIVQGDQEAFMACLNRDVEWDDREGWPGVRRVYHGRKGVAEWWDAFMGVGAEIVDLETEDLAELSDDRVLLGVLGTFRSRAGGRPAEFKARAWWVFSLRGGKISRARPFWDRRQALEAAGLLQRPGDAS